MSKLSVFGAFGRPYLELPTAAGFTFLCTLGLLGALLCTAIASHTPKAA